MSLQVCTGHASDKPAFIQQYDPVNADNAAFSQYNIEYGERMLNDSLLLSSRLTYCTHRS